VTECTPLEFEFGRHFRRRVTARFDGGWLTSDGGGVLLREADARIGLLSRLASCFVDYRNPASVEHTVRDLVSQRVYGLALGYEDLNDHHRIRDDATLALLVGKRDLTGEDRVRLRDKGHPLASASGLNRLELSVPETAATDRYKRIAAETKRMDALFTSLFLEAREEVPEEIVLDIDATDDPLHGTQEGRFFNGYYRSCCYLPLYIFCGKHLLLARLRTSDRDAADGTVRELAPIIERIRSAWPETRIILRGDSGFCRDRIMVWCEQHGVDYVVGLPGNARLTERIEPALQEARKMFEATGEPARQFRQFSYQTRTSWSRRRRVVAKAEWLAKGENPRFVVTSLAPDRVDKQQLHEQLYCARGKAENRIKEQLALFHDRTSTRSIAGNQLRLYFSSFACVLLDAMRRLALAGTRNARLQCDTLRLRFFKIAACLRITHRRVWIALSSVHPWQTDYAEAHANLVKKPLFHPPA